jgi:hypothetical protein
MAKLMSLMMLAGSAIASNMHSDHIVAMPMHQFKQDCGKPSTLHIAPGAASLLQNVPGAGVDKFKPFETVLKDGYLMVDCVKDYMYYRGDKFGDNKHDYKLGPVSNVSIVHYEAFVAKEDKAEMTPAICFEFCRTVPNMGFFGIVNGRGCYCTPYFTPMESDSSQCDAVCEGDNTQMCGGKSKSSVFAMHMCDSTEEDVGIRAGTASEMKASLSSKAAEAEGYGQVMQSMAAAMQKSFGSVGDSGATGLMQKAKVFAGTLVHTADGKEASTGLGGLAKDASALKDFTDPATVTKAERTMEAIDEAVAEAEGLADKLDDLNGLANYDKRAQSGALKQYYPVMYFVDKEFESNPSTCSGDLVAEPVVAESADGCATACDANIHECVGFQSVKASGTELCFLFSKFNTAFHYTGCGGKAAFLQDSAAPFAATCYAKLSKFEGTTLKPNPSGKCAQCFKEVTKADRCFPAAK